MSETKKFCETSLMFEHNNVRNEEIMWDLLIFSKLKTAKTKEFCETSFKNGKLSAELTASYQCVLRFFQSTCLKYCACHEKLMPDMQPLWGNQRPEIPTSLMNMSLRLKVVRTPVFLTILRALFRHLNFQKWSGASVFCAFWLGNVLRATTACTFSTSQFQKWSEHVFFTFWLGNALRATATCNFSSLIWPAGSAPATLASLFSTLRSHKSLEKHGVSRLSYLFAHLNLLSSDSFSSILLSSNLSLLSDPFHLCFLSVHLVGSLTSKLPSIMNWILVICYTCSKNRIKRAIIIWIPLKPH